MSISINGNEPQPTYEAIIMNTDHYNYTLLYIIDIEHIHCNNKKIQYNIIIIGNVKKITNWVHSYNNSKSCIIIVHTYKHVII